MIEDFLDDDLKESHSSCTLSDEERIIKIIEEGIENNKTLLEVEEKVKSTFDDKLGIKAQALIERSYIDRLIQSWNEESFTLFCDYISELSTLTNDFPGQSAFQDLLEDLDKVSSFEDCCNFFDQSVYSPLVAELVEKSTWLKNEETLLLDKLKYKCLLELKNQVDAIKDELDLMHELLALLKQEDLVNTLHLLLLDTFAECSDTDITKEFQILLSHILSLEVGPQSDSVPRTLTLSKLQCAVRKNINKKIFFLTKDFKDLISSFIKPVEEPQESFLDGRFVLEVKGKHLVCSKMLPKIESYTGFSHIEEVRFVGAAVFHVDADLKADIWHGKNIVIVADDFVVCKDSNYEWDVSGKDAETKDWSEPAGQAEDGSGLKGADGINGESGGNVCLFVKVIENGGNLTIKSLGGKGSRGQDGGNGADGSNGQHLKDFEINFPPAAKYFNSSKVENLQVTLESISKTLDVVERCMYGNTELRCPMGKSEFDSTFNVQNIKKLKSMYVEATTAEGFKITFSFFFEAYWVSLCQGYVLHEGSEGEVGKNGGMGGFGGQQGFRGDIEIPDQDLQQITRICNDVGDSENLDGKPGQWGKPGKKGADFGYLDSTLYGMIRFPQQFSSSNENFKLTLNFQNVKSSDSVWCPLKKSYCRITKVTQIEKKTQKHAIKQRFKSVQREQAQRKKTICKREMKEKYGEKKSVSSMHIESAVDKMLSQLEEKIERKQNVNTNFKVNKQISYFSNSWSTFDASESKFKPKEETGKDCHNHKAFQPIDDKSNSSQLPVGISLPVSQISLENLKKYNKKVEILRQIQNRLTDENLTSISSTVQDFVETKSLSVSECDNSLEKFFFEDSITNRSRIVDLCKNGRDKSLSSDLLPMFIKEFHTGSISFQLKLEEKNLQAIEVMNSAVTTFEANKAKEVSSRLVPMKRELSKNNRSINRDLTESILKESNPHKAEFEDKVNEDKFLSALYRQFMKQTNSNFDLDQLPDDVLSLVLQAFYLCLEKVGPMSSTCRELLSEHFKTNILVYKEHKNGFELVFNHNPRACSKVHILLKLGKFFKLSVDCEFNKLTHHYKTLSTFFTSIVNHIDLFNETEELERFLKASPFSQQATNFLNKASKKITYVIEQDENIKTISNSFESTEDKLLLTSRLEKLKLEFIGYEAILSHMAAHFSAGGSHLSAREMCFVINLTLKSALDEPKTSKLVSWTIASNHQTQWIVEIALLRFEIFLKQVLSPEVKSKWRNYISSRSETEKLMFLLRRIDEDNTHTVSFECFDEILFLFSSIPKAHIGLDEIDMVEWKYYLKDKYFASKVDVITEWTNDQLKELSFIFMMLENKLGFKMCETMLDMIEKKKGNIRYDWEKNIVIQTLKTLTSSDVSFDKEVLDKLSNEEISDWKNVVNTECLANGHERSLGSLFKLINMSENTSTNISSQSKNVYGVVTNVISSIDCLSSTGNNIAQRKENVQNLARKLSPKNKTSEKNRYVEGKIDRFIKEEKYDDLVKYLVEVNFDCLQLNSTTLIPFVAKVIETKMDKKLKQTQIITIVTMLQNQNNTLAQVSTGEGKTLIVVVLSVIKALLKNIVSVITSSKVLAIRDAEAYKEIFEYFGIKVGHNCSEDIEERKKVYSGCQVVYGELGNFQRDYLLDRFHNRNIRGDFAFDVTVVDEVDSMLLDKASNILYLSHDIPGLNKLESIFIHIWKCLNNPKKKEGIDASVYSAMLKETIVFDIFGQITKECIRDFVVPKCEKVVSTTWEFLAKQQIMDLKGNLLLENMNEFENKVCSVPQNCLQLHHLNFLIQRVLARERLFDIPNYLKPYVEEHLENWIRSGANALMMQNGKDYVVDVDRSGNGTERNPIIIILDQSTGTDLFNSQWDEALHQFLQLKHGCKLSLLSLKAVYISNVSYLKLSETLYGLSGTLGSQRERDLLQELYKKENTCLDFVTIPTAKAKRFSEYLPILCSHEDWGKNIYDSSVHEIKNKRSVLIVCESVNDVLNLKEFFSTKIPGMVHTYTRDYEELTVAKRIEPGHVIIATNLAGRGTDILISKALEDAGGLHEILAYFPDNCRIGEQAYGRVARNGQPGTAQMIVRVNKDILHRGTTQYLDMIKQRDVDEITRLAEVKTNYKSQIVPEENWLMRFEKLYENLRKAPLNNLFESIKSILTLNPSQTSLIPFDFKSSLHNNAPGPIQKILPDFLVSNEKEKDDVKYVLLQTCLNEWAFWLDRHSRRFSVQDNTSELEESFEQLSSTCKALCSEDFDNCLKHIKDPCQLIKLGLVYLGKGNVVSVKAFDKVIKEEPLLSEIALYYRACANTTNQDLDKSDVVADLEVVATKLKKQIQGAALASSLIDWMKEYNPSSILQIDSFKEQQLNISKVYNLYLNSIHSMIGSEVTAEMLTLNPDDHQFALKLLNDLIGKGVLTKPTMSDCIREEDLRFAWKYCISPQKMNKLLGPLKGKELSEMGVFEVFEKVLPSRELFWDELKKHNMLVDEKECALLLMQEVEVLDPSLMQNLQNINEGNNQHDYIHLYSSDQDSRFKVIDKDTLEELVGDSTDKIKFLTSNNAIFFDKKAKFVCLEHNRFFEHFDSISQDDFEDIGIHKEIALEILNELESLGVIKHKISNEFSLAICSENIGELHLLKHNAYNEEVKSLMEFRFAFRIAYEKITLLSKHLNSFPLPLNASLHKRIIKDLEENNLTKKPTVVFSNNVSKTISSMYPSSMLTTDIAKLLQDQFGDKKNNIVTDLIKNDWLSLTTRFRWNKKYKIKIPNVQKLPGEFADESMTIAAVLSNYQKSSDTFQKIKEKLIEVLENSKGSIYSIDTPKLSLTPLCDALQKANIPISELPLFSLNGFDQLLILEDKKWTRKMKGSLFAVVTFGLAQVALGIACEMSGSFTEVGAYLLSEGISDLIFAGSCMVTGYCTWRSYRRHKLISMIFTTVSAAASIYKTLRTNFGENIISNISFDTVKGYTRKVGSETKACWNSVWAASNSVKKETVKKIVKEVSVHSVKATSRGIAIAALDSQLDNLGNIFTQAIYSSINDIIHRHRVSDTILEVRQTFCERDAERLITDKYMESINTYKNELESTFKHIVELSKTALRFCASPQTVKNRLNQDDMLYYDIFSLYVEAKKQVENCFKQHSYQFVIVNKTMDHLEHELQFSIQQANAMNLPKPAVDQEVLKGFQSKTVKILKEEMTKIFSDQLKFKVISPILDYTANTLIARSSLNSVMSSNFKFKEIEADSIERMQEIYREIAGNPKSKTKTNHLEQNNGFDNLNYNKNLLTLFKKQHSIPIFSEILNTNLAVDSSFLETLCSVVPLALKREGINLPGFQLVIEQDGMQQIISTRQNTTDNIPTVVIAPDANVITNIKKNSFLVMEVFDAIHTQLLQTYPMLKAFNIETLRSTIAKAIKEDSSIQEQITRCAKPKITIQEINTINLISEQKLPYQHINKDGRWEFSPAVDVDLREDMEFEVPSKSQDYILEGFKTALAKINQKIYKDLQRPLELAFDDFFHSHYEITQRRNKSSINNFDCFASKYELKILLPVRNGKKLDKFMVTMSLVNCTTNLQPREPMGPHILYEVIPEDMKLLQHGVRGHVLLPFEYKETFSVESCHSAGELILPTPQLIVLGDSTLKNLRGGKCCYKKHKSLAELRTICESLAEKVKELRCTVVVHFGTLIDVDHIPPEQVINHIADLLIDMKTWQARIAVIGFTSRNTNPALVDTLNQQLQDSCKVANVEYWCPSHIFNTRSKYVKIDGSLNRKGRRSFIANFTSSKVISGEEEKKPKKVNSRGLESTSKHVGSKSKVIFSRNSHFRIRLTK